MLVIVQNQVGAVVRVRMLDQDGNPVSLAGATTLEILARPPRGPAKVWAAAEVAEGVLGYTTQAGDLAEFGQWRLQGHLVNPTQDVRGLAFSVDVRIALDA